MSLPLPLRVADIVPCRHCRGKSIRARLRRLVRHYVLLRAKNGVQRLQHGRLIGNGMAFSNLTDYRRVHSTKSNLLIHLVTVPLFVMSAVLWVLALLVGAIPAVMVWTVTAIIAVMLQRHGHRREPESQPEVTGALAIAGQWFAEQFVIFPWFVVSGGWLKQWREAPPV